MTVLHGNDAFLMLMLSPKTELQFSEKDFYFPENLL